MLFTDVRGLADLEWNETVTKEQKHYNRNNTLVKAKIHAEKAAKEKNNKSSVESRMKKGKRDKRKN